MYRFVRSVAKMKRVRPASKTYVALLRGINVGGKNKLPMTHLVQLFIEQGCDEVRTFIQSGNVIFNAKPEVAIVLADRITEQIAKRYAYRPPVILRTEGDMDAVVSNNPFLKRNLPEEDLHVLFLADIPKASAIGLLDSNRSPPDEFAVLGREIYLRLPNGAGTTKLTNAYFDLKLSTISTGRNWRTVTKLLELARRRLRSGLASA
jgi:uncharacterized protein (DUF1697 family)